MNKKKILTLALTLSMVAILAIGGTIAYFTDSEQVTNTMTIGDVQINNEELMKNPDFEEGGEEDKYIEFDSDDLTLYPISNTKGINLYNKMVSVFNTSKVHEAYIRTIVLFELNEDVSACSDDCLNGIHFAYTDGDYTTTIDGKVYQGRGTTNYKLDEAVTVNNKKYQVVVFTDKQGRAIAKDESQDSLASVWLDENVTDEQAAAWAGDLDVIVFAQGIQADNLTHEEAMEALGVVNESNLNKWLGTDDAIINDVYVATNENP